MPVDWQNIGPNKERTVMLSQPQETVLTRKEIIDWWEDRRIPFNAYVGLVGVASWVLVLIAGSAAVEPGVDFEEPIGMLVGPFIYAFLANICYTLGWIVDIVFYRGIPRKRLHRAGVIFFIVLTASPGVWAVVAWLMTLVSGHKLD